MAEGRSDPPAIFSPLEEEYIRESEDNGDNDQQLLRDKDIASQKLWVSFQDSAMAVAHLFRDCQYQAGVKAWVPFHESASAVTHLYKDSVDVCRQCCESGIKYGQRKRTNEILAWVKRKRKHIKREELIAFLLDKPTTSDSSKHDDFERSVGPQLSGLSLGHMCPSHYQSASFPSTPNMSPRSPRRRLCRDDTVCNDGDNLVNSSGRKRSANSSSLDSMDCGFSPIAKRIRL